jgi:hypothetical protein
MSVELTIAGVSCAVLAIGHATVGHWVLPGVAKERLPGTPFGPPRMTVGMIRFTWHIVTVVLVAFAVLLVSLAWATDADRETLVLRWFAAFWLAGTAMLLWLSRRRPSDLLRLPVALVMVLIAALCWIAST